MGLRRFGAVMFLAAAMPGFVGNIAHAANFVTTFAKPVGDYLGSAEYRRGMARVTVQRALMECKQQLGL